MCMDASAVEMVEAPSSSAPFSISPILVDLKGGSYVRPILPGLLVDLLTGKRAAGGDGSISGGNQGRDTSGRSDGGGSDGK